MDLALEGQRATLGRPPPENTNRACGKSGRRLSHPDLSVAVTVDGPVIGNADKA